MAVLDYIKRTFEMIAAAEGNNLAGVQEAIAGGASVNHQAPHDKMTALHMAAGNGDDAMVDYLLDEGADVRLEDIYGRTPSVVAIECGWYDLADHLTDLECQAIQREKLTTTLKGTSRPDESSKKTVHEERTGIPGNDDTKHEK